MPFPKTLTFFDTWANPFSGTKKVTRAVTKIPMNCLMLPFPLSTRTLSTTLRSLLELFVNVDLNQMMKARVED